MRLENKVAVITGAAHGIGFACAERLVAEGAKVMLADIDAPALEAAAAGLGMPCEVADVGVKADVERLVARTVERLGRIDILISNAGITSLADFLDVTEEQYDQVPYVVSKGGSAQLTKVMAISLAKHGIRVVGIGPGTILTDLARNAVLSSDAARRKVMSRTPLGRGGEPSEIASVAAFLASDDGSYITGQTIYPDGGRLALNYTVPVAD